VQCQYPREDYVCIELEDDSSGSRVLQIELSLKEAALAFFFNGYTEVDVEYFNLDVLGMKREHKTEQVESESYLDFDAMCERALVHEVDGWVFRKPDRHNHHRQHDGFYRCDYVRFVEVEDA
jgi:hypothetical protein